MASLLFRIEERSEGRFKVCRSVGRDPRRRWPQGKIAAIFHIEGAEAIDADLKSLDVLHKAGLRSLGPRVEPRQCRSATACRSASRPRPIPGPGLTEAGKALVRRCNELKIMVDVSHLNEKGFWDVARHSTRAHRRHPFQCPCAVRLLAQPDRRPDPRSSASPAA